MYTLKYEHITIYLKVRRKSYPWALRSFQIFTGPLFQIELHLLRTALLNGFQSPGLGIVALWSCVTAFTE